jgi:transposase-like protein
MAAITTKLVETGEKRDTRGRRVMPAGRRAQMVEAYRASGLTMAGFARREKLKYATFAGWVTRAQRMDAAPGAIKFAEVKLPFAPSASRADQLEVQMPDGTVLRGSRVVEVIALARALKA